MQTRPSMNPTPAAPKVVRTDEQWRAMLGDDLSYQVLRHGATERPFTGEYNDTTTAGDYKCRGCGEVLFTSEEKFASHCGWPSFHSPAAEDKIRYVEDNSLPGRPRIEVRCSNCDSHLGHVFEGEGYPTPTDLRYCINSVSLDLHQK
ncbi:peptide-methionine (R)-S-oxide reductase MsrB [Parenemella sanctibonifatiensis]|nr:peptide-methionine (R)-S-oxide reductase MsrB [Parenemella sanctibonifatiensis]